MGLNEALKDHLDIGDMGAKNHNRGFHFDSFTDERVKILFYGSHLGYLRTNPEFGDITKYFVLLAQGFNVRKAREESGISVTRSSKINKFLKEYFKLNLKCKCGKKFNHAGNCEYKKHYKIRNVICEICKKKFETTHPTQKFCSLECKKESARETHKKASIKYYYKNQDKYKKWYHERKLRNK